MKDYDIAHSCDDLKKLIAENPDLPIVFEANDEANFGDYEVTICTSVHARIGEVIKDIREKTKKTSIGEIIDE